MSLNTHYMYMKAVLRELLERVGLIQVLYYLRHLISHCAIYFQLFAYAAQEHIEKYGSTFEQCAKISYKNHKHSVHNPNACVRKEIPFKGITHSKMICKPITFAMSAPTADGSAAAVVCSKGFMESNQMQVCCN